MINGIKNEMRNMVIDWYKYMNTSIPKGANKKRFTDLVYSNKGKKLQFLDQHEEIDVRLLEEVALHEFLMKSEEEIIEATKIVR